MTMSDSAALCTNDLGTQYGILYLRSQNASVECSADKAQMDATRKYILKSDNFLLGCYVLVFLKY